MRNSNRTSLVAAMIVVIGTSLLVAAPVRAVTTAEDAGGGNDGIKNGKWGFHVASKELNPWWQVDLGEEVAIDRVVVYNRADSCAPRTSAIRVLVAGEDGDPDCKTFREVHVHDGTTFYGAHGGPPLTVSLKEQNITARIVRLAIDGRCSLALDEVEVYPRSEPAKNIALGKPADQISVSPYSWKGTLSDAQYAAALGGQPPSAPIAMESSAVGGRPASADDVANLLAQTKKLAERLKGRADSSQLEPLLHELASVEKAITSGACVGSDSECAARLQSIRRNIAFANPLLKSIDKLLFIGRHNPGGPYHMCDQYYGCNAKPGGALLVLEDPFGENPRVVNLLENSVVENGRLKGQKLQGGAFLSPEVSFDGQTVYFAYSECGAKQTYTWTPQCCYHIFKCDADGGNLTQLTDGEWDDFDPCELPGGRIAFTTTRRGGYLRCGRHCPVYTVFSMESDGSDIQCMSYHETHEWHPSVSNDGMLVYTRWDYVDRDTNVAHHIWMSYPDGRDPRSYHGNYPVWRESRPWMEMSIRAIPGSHKFVATAAGHHGHAMGSLVLIDQRVEDDNAMSQLQRLTPDVPFPEASGRGSIPRCEQFATAWPLSEDDYLCVYDPAAKHHAIWWIDRDGNREMVYRHPVIPCMSPIPLTARPRPPIIPEQTVQTARALKAAGGKVPQATVAVMNVYDSDFAWPDGAKVSKLRIIQVLPKTTPPPNEPRIGVASQTNARMVLGTVPVEEDGSVYFEAPVECPIYFQAIDEDGFAIQSMRSATYVHPGEQLTCQGCHERKHSPVSGARSPARPTLPLAMRRGPSKITADIEGSNPFNYPRLVQGVLDGKCAGCHREKGAVDLSGELDKNGFTRSYNALAGKYGFYFHVTNGSINSGVHGGSRSIAGKFGARAAPLMKYLSEEHYGVNLTDEELHRITLWLDANSEFLGAYENEEAQRRGEIVMPLLY